ncbi:MAG: efflux RND transporter permease subunit [Oscillospiraceae bacterium]|nr:efflux RND transporter permease subunit [Oscillospiraceae bacterium]
MAKFSVKRPLTVFVVVLAVVVLGIVAYLRMTPDLLPNMDFPYVVIVTADPGASPEAVEEEITRPMEQSMATLDQIKEVTSTSQNSVSMVMLEFEDGVNMDTISVDIQQKISVLEGQWSDMVGTPYVLKINPSMIPVMVAAVSREGSDVYALSDLVTDELTGKLEGVSGVASVTVSGALTRQAHVILDQAKMEALSAKLADAVKAQLKKAEGKLYAAKQQVEDGEKALSDAKRAAADGVAGTVGDSADEVYKNLKELYDKLKDADIGDILGDIITDPEGSLEKLQQSLESLREQTKKMLDDLESGKLKAQMEGDISDFLVQMMDGMSQMTGAELQLSQAKSQIESGLKQLREAFEKVESQTDLGGLLSISTVSGLLTAQNFSMPAGYIDDNSGVSYMVSVGQKFENSTELENMVLFDLGLDGVEPITLGDVATVVVTDDSDQLYTKLNDENGILLSFNKQSNYATAAVSNNLTDRFRELESQYEGLTFVPLMDQGDYIYLIVETILSSLLWGALFSVVVLFLFLRDWRPTVITLLSIPVSVIFAVVLMYFTGVTINMISLSGLAVSVGMLVDNSVVVIENIYRLRAKGATIVQAAVSGAQQVLGAVTASTLTTVCVFAPIVFVEGLTRQLFTDLALTITYSLLASLLVSLTLVPAMASGMLRREFVPKPGLLDKIYPAYRRAIAWSLDHKAGVLLLSLVLLVTTAWGAVSRGFTFMPEIDMNNLSVTVTMPEDITRAEAVDLADQVVERVMSVENVESAGFMMGSGDMGGLSMASGDNGEFDVTGYLTMPEGTFGSDAGKEIEALCADLPCKVTTAGVMSGMMSYMTGTGVSLRVYSSDMESLQSAARSLGQRMEQVEGVQDVSDGLEDAAPALQVVVDRNKAMTKGITVAQIYMQVAAALQDTTTVADVTLDGESMEMIVDAAAGGKLTREKLMDMTISPDSGAMSSSMSSGMSSMSGMDSSMSSAMGSMGSGMSSSSASAGLSQLTGGESQDEDTSFKLGEVAEVKETVSLNSIQRDQQRRCITVSAAVADGYNVTKVTTAVQKALGSVTLPEGVTVEFDGENEQIMNAMQQLLLMLLLGVVLVYLIMVAQFQSLKAPFIVMFTIPLAFTGGFLALLLSGIEVSVISLIGFVMLVGIIVNNGIVLVDYINQQRLAGMGLREAIIDAGVTRLRPILMTSLTTILGLVVTALAKNAGTALIQPIALVCIGGLLYATLMTLFVVPCMYEILNKKELHQVEESDLTPVDM